MFQVDDDIFYPAHGIARVVSIEEREIGGATTNLYILEILDKKMSVMIPVDNAESVGLREVIKAKAVEQVYDILRADPEMGQSQWNKRYQVNNEKLKTGASFDTAEVVRDLTMRNEKKNLGTKESRMLANARQLLASEIAYVLEVDEEDVERKMDEALGLLDTVEEAN